MKKQIFLIILISLIWSATTKGQNPLDPSIEDKLSALPTCLISQKVSCPSSALKPVPGSPYTYSISVPTNLDATATYKYRWFVTQDPNILTTSAGNTSFTTDIADASGSGTLIRPLPLTPAALLFKRWRRN